MRFAVTGGSGFIGSHLIDYLKENTEAKVINIDAVVGHDITKIGQMRDALQGCDAVFHLATLPLELSLKFPYMVAYDLYVMSLNLCQLCQEKVFKTLIQVSSSEAYGSAVEVPMTEEHPMKVRTLYAAGKASADLVLMAYRNTFGIDAAIARPFNNYGPGQEYEKGGVISKTIYRVLKGERPIIYGDGHNIRDFIYVKDTVRGIYAVYKEPYTRGRTINIGANQPISVKELVNMICKLSGKKFNPIYKPARVADVDKHVADTKLAKNMCDFQATIKLEEGLKKTIAWAKKKYC